jgi:hypothetical protein
MGSIENKTFQPGGKQTRTFALTRASSDKKARTVELSFSSETPIERSWGIEILDHGKKSVRLDRLRNGGPLLVDYDIFNANQTKQILSGGGSGDTINVNLHIQTGVQQTVRAEFLSMIPEIRRQAVYAVADAKRRRSPLLDQ